MNSKQTKRLGAGLALGCGAAALCALLVLGPHFFNQTPSSDTTNQKQDAPAFVEETLKTSNLDNKVVSTSSAVPETVLQPSGNHSQAVNAAPAQASGVSSVLSVSPTKNYSGTKENAASHVPSPSSDAIPQMGIAIPDAKPQAPALGALAGTQGSIVPSKTDKGSSSSSGSGVAPVVPNPVPKPTPAPVPIPAPKPAPAPAPEVVKELKTKVFDLLSSEERARSAYPNITNIVYDDEYEHAYLAVSSSAFNNGAYETSAAKLYTFRIEDLSLESVRDLPFKTGFNSRIDYYGRYLAITEDDGSLAVINLRDFSIQELKQKLEGAQAAGGINHTIYKGDILFVAGSTKLDKDWNAAESDLILYNATRNERVWDIALEPGMYWSAPYLHHDTLLVPTDGGAIFNINHNNGSVITKSIVNNGAHLRSKLVSVRSNVWILSDYDGNLLKLEKADDGSMRVVGQVKFADKSTSTPRYEYGGGSAFVGGLKYGKEKDAKGIIARINIEDMSIIATAEAPAEVQSRPEIITGEDGSLKVYFCANTNPGALYVWDGVSSQIKEAYVPEKSLQNYCMASPYLIGDYILYSNDAGALFALPAVEPIVSKAAKSTEETSASSSEEVPQATESSSSKEDVTSAVENLSQDAPAATLQEASKSSSETPKEDPSRKDSKPSEEQSR